MKQGNHFKLHEPIENWNATQVSNSKLPRRLSKCGKRATQPVCTQRLGWEFKGPLMQVPCSLLTLLGQDRAVALGTLAAPGKAGHLSFHSSSQDLEKRLGPAPLQQHGAKWGLSSSRSSVTDAGWYSDRGQIVPWRGKKYKRNSNLLKVQCFYIYSMPSAWLKLATWLTMSDIHE